jgi:hypothetical protein
MSEKGVQKDAAEIGLEELQQRISDEISETNVLVGRIREAAPDKDIEEQMVLILEKLQTLQKKIDQAIQSSARCR